MPEINAANIIALLSRLAHILSAVILAGGLVYLRTMIVRPREAATAADSAERYFLGLRSRWAAAVMACAMFLIVSGLYNYIVKVRAEKFDMAYHALFGIKFLLGLFVMFVASLVAGRTEAAQRAREKMRTWLNLAIAAAVIVIVIASTMRTFRGEPKIEGQSSPFAPREDQRLEDELAFADPPFRTAFLHAEREGYSRA
jgi:putative copper export protein